MFYSYFVLDLIISVCSPAVIFLVFSVFCLLSSFKNIKQAFVVLCMCASVILKQLNDFHEVYCELYAFGGLPSVVLFNLVTLLVTLW